MNNITDQLGGYADEVAREVYFQMKKNPDLSKEQAIEIVKIAVEDMKTDCLWLKLNQVSDAIDSLASSVRFLER